MSHPKELIQSILNLVQKEYPTDIYRYEIERAIPGTRMHPDILIFNKNDEIKCAIEIGYTRPEKLTSYRIDHKIPDVRWYDKKGKLHSGVEERIIKVKVAMEPEGLFSLYGVSDLVDCYQAECAEADSESTEEEWEKLSEKEKVTILDEQEADRRLYVDTLIVTDFNSVWLPSFCDKCGSFWHADEDEAILLMGALNDCRAPKEFSREHGGRLMVGRWIEIADAVKAHFDMDLEFDQYIVLDASNKNNLRHTSYRIRDKELKR